jgi:tRNA G18 (ribose-2'-O)-methylase SpoU
MPDPKTISPVGEQLDGKELYERQKLLRASQKILPAPTIVAVRLKVSENIGALLRLADAVGSPRVIFLNDQDHNIRQVHRAARNAESFVKWDVMDLEEFLKDVTSFQPLIALELTSASTDIFATQLPTHFTFVVGSERHGIPRELLAHCQQAIHIPMFGVNGSMNVTHALAVALFEWRRQHASSRLPKS